MIHINDNTPIAQLTVGQLREVLVSSPIKAKHPLDGVIDNKKYNVTETCSILNITAKTLRTRTKAGKIICGYNKSNNRKYYFGREIKKHYNASW